MTEGNSTSATISAALTTIMIVLDKRLDWNFGAEFMGAALVIIFALPALGIGFIRYLKRAKKEMAVDETEKT